MTLKQKLILLAIIPLLSVILFSSTLIHKSFQVKDNSNALQVLMQLAVANSELVHELQKERGLTAGFYGSNFSAEFQQRLNKQRQSTEQLKAAKLRKNNDVKEQVERLGLASLLQQNIAQLNQVDKIRQQVDRNQITLAQALAFYTNLNGELLSVISAIAEMAENSEVKQQGLAYFYFVQGKERAGIERAVLSRAFAQDSMDLAWYKKYSALVLLQNTYLAEFENLADQTSLRFYQQQMNSPAITTVNNYREIVEQKNISGGFNQEASQWFDASTQRINILKDIENHTATHLLELATEHGSNATNALWFYVVTMVVVLALCFVIALVVIRKIDSQVGNLVETLNYCADNNALDRTIEVTSNDEFSRISRGLNKLLTSFNSAIKELATSSDSLATSSMQNTAAVAQTTHALTSQKDQTLMVASAVEEMTLTINEVSKNITDTSDAARNAEVIANESNATVNKSIEQISKVSNDVEEVHVIIARLNESSTEITNVVDVIKSVAEQTNLLALNAAIEAARAGEQGRGFAVVADEVRTLAQRTQESTKQIEDIITHFAASTNDAFNLIVHCKQDAQSSVDAASEMTSAIDAIKESITTISMMAAQIASSAEEQVSVAQEISHNVNQISTAADESAVAAQQISATSQNQSSLADNLKSLSASFVV